MSKFGLCFVVLLFLASSAGATLYTWISTSDVNWMNVANWDAGIPQATGDRASINNGHVAELSGTHAITLDRIYTYGPSGSTVRVKDNASITMTYASGCDIYLGHAFSTGTGCGRLEIQDNASVTGGVMKIWQAVGSGTTAEIDISGGTLETFYWDIGGGADSNATINHSGGDINLLYRTWVGSTTDANETNPEIIRWNISGGRMRYTGILGSSSVFSVGNGSYQGNPYQDIVITQTGGDVDFGDMVHFNLGDMGNNNTVKWSISGGSLKHNYLFRNSRDDQSASYGQATATFEVIGADPNINFGSYVGASKSTLQGVIDSGGLATINVVGDANFNDGSIINIKLADGVTVDVNTQYTIMEAANINDFGLAKPSVPLVPNTLCCWDFEIVDGVSSDTLVVTWKGGCDENDCAYCSKEIAYDLNDDCKVDFQDIALVAGQWLNCNLVPASACLE